MLDRFRNVYAVCVASRPGFQTLPDVIPLAGNWVESPKFPGKGIPRSLLVTLQRHNDRKDEGGNRSEGATGHPTTMREVY